MSPAALPESPGGRSDFFAEWRVRRQCCCAVHLGPGKAWVFVNSSCSQGQPWRAKESWCSSPPADPKPGHVLCGAQLSIRSWAAGTTPTPGPPVGCGSQSHQSRERRGAGRNLKGPSTAGVVMERRKGVVGALGQHAHPPSGLARKDGRP